MARTKPLDAPISIPQLNLQTLRVKLIGDSPLITHRWSDEAKRLILGRQMKKAATAKQARDPKAEYESSLYAHPEGGHGFPVAAFKRAIVDAASFAQDVTKVVLRGAVHPVGEFVKIKGSPQMREDTVRLAGGGSSDLRYRAEFSEWSAELTLQFNAGVLSQEQVVALLDLAGFSIGIGDWRPQKNGSFGRFHVERRAK